MEQSARIDGPITPDGQAGLPGGPADDDDSDDVDDTAPPATSIAWDGCDDFGIPAWVTEGTSGWECGSLDVEMNPFGDSSDLPDVRLALTRHRATGDRVGAIVLNPGGPGAAGLPTAWGVRPSMPTELLRGFDIVAWDPRGVGRSTPQIDCGGARSTESGFIETCVATTGPLSKHLAAPYSAEDLEAIRVALGEPALNFLGFSYGSILGATYAARHPDTVGGFVLDGVTDPEAGSADGPFEDGFAVFADDGTDAAYDRLVELCDATARCLPDRSANDVIGELPSMVEDLPTDHWDDVPEVVERGEFDDLIDLSLGYAGDWELLATALADADDGDASALASFIAGSDALGDDLDDTDDGESDDPDGANDVDNFADANFMIYCADFGPLITEWSFCDDMPVNDPRLAAVEEVDVPRPILVIGTEYDPLTPGLHAPEFADALGDATHMIWDGVGHTAFPGWTDCIDDAVADQFLGRSLPPDGTRCTMVADVAADDDEGLGDRLFGYDRNEALDWVADTFEFEGVPADDASCRANALVPASDDDIDDDLVSRVVLGLTTDDASVARQAAEATC